MVIFIQFCDYIINQSLVHFKWVDCMGKLNYISIKLFLFIYFLKFYLFNFSERGREGGREGEKHQCVVASCGSPTGDLAHNPGMCHDCE